MKLAWVDGRTGGRMLVYEAPKQQFFLRSLGSLRKITLCAQRKYISLKQHHVRLEIDL